MHRPTLIWIDLTLATRHSEIDRVFLKHFDVRHCTNIQSLGDDFDMESGIAICFEYDYPDRPGLDFMRTTKERYPQVPVLMLTSQHSEKLAVWAYRNQVFDYLVKPISEDDLRRCLDVLSAIHREESRQDKRSIVSLRSKIPTEIPGGQRFKDVRLAPAIHYVARNFRGKIRNSDVAELCGMSLYHFSHAFTQTFSLTFQEYILRYRVFEACKELQHPNVPVANVAYSVGFNDPSYFSRVFRRYIGYSPTKYCELFLSGDFHDRLTDILEKLKLPELHTTTGDRRKKERRYLDLDRRRDSAS